MHATSKTYGYRWLTRARRAPAPAFPTRPDRTTLRLFFPTRPDPKITGSGHAFPAVTREATSTA